MSTYLLQLPDLIAEKCYNTALKTENNVTIILKKSGNNVTLTADDKSLTPETEAVERKNE